MPTLAQIQDTIPISDDEDDEDSYGPEFQAVSRGELQFPL
jgi:hypothetical protein